MFLIKVDVNFLTFPFNRHCEDEARGRSNPDKTKIKALFYSLHPQFSILLTGRDTSHPYFSSFLFGLPHPDRGKSGYVKTGAVASVFFLFFIYSFFPYSSVFAPYLPCDRRYEKAIQKNTEYSFTFSFFIPQPVNSRTFFCNASSALTPICG
jgi:hypothetical protein